MLKLRDAQVQNGHEIIGNLIKYMNNPKEGRIVIGIVFAMLLFGMVHIYFFLFHRFMPWADRSWIAKDACAIISEHLNLYEKEIQCDFVNRHKILLRAYGFHRNEDIDNLRLRTADVKEENFKEFEIEVEFFTKK